MKAPVDCSVQGSRSAHAFREQGGTLTEYVNVRGSKRAVEQSPGMRKFV